MVFAGGVALANPPASPTGTPIDETYRLQFAKCDSEDVFQNVQFPIRGRTGKIIWYGCKSDPSRFTRFERVAAAAGRPEAVIFESKLRLG